MTDAVFDPLKLENQLCFPLYACSREIIRQYNPLLDRLNLTYTQYIAMMALWEHRSLTVKALGDMLYLDSGTLTPLLRKLESKGYITRRRSQKDERSLIVSVTEAGDALKENAAAIPEQIARCTNLAPEEAVTLYRILYKILRRDSMKEPDTHAKNTEETP